MRVAVQGAGIIGLSIAWRALSAGLDVTVHDDNPARGASNVAAGMLAPVAEAYFGEADLLRLSLASAARWPEFAAGLGEVGYRDDGTLLVGRTGDDLRELARLFQLYADWRLPAEKVDPRALEPALTPRLRGGLLTPGDHQVDPRRVLAALRERVPVSATPPGKVDVTVVATGAWTGQPRGSAIGLPGGGAVVGLPVRPVHGEVLRLRGEPSIRHVVRGYIDGKYVYIVPRKDGEVVVGATTAERGFSTRVTAEGVRDLLDTAIEVLPELADYELVEARAGLRPGTPDNAPLIGRLDPRTIVSTGHYRHGVLLAPITAEVVTSLLLDREPSVDLAPFAPGRFS
ncbi:glycine oxidase ThiO [Longispora fulva]|uniref:Glycine oxidase n=1 Tax=Longispora fulva TaxID=619741 RepID=A0A8J7GGA7_9ACTN|nr:FAD-dependent oxidoreductase [Longispora fulva]MBG6140118.1 glycine oxidase [Longispora fulva]GIG57506.1 glycine oxidase ThiO [Longispora fulva]